VIFYYFIIVFYYYHFTIIYFSLLILFCSYIFHLLIIIMKHHFLLLLFFVFVIILFNFINFDHAEKYSDYIVRTKQIMKPIIIKNILIVGLSQSGKSSLKNFLINTTQPSTLSYGLSLTSNPYVTTIVGDDIVLNIIDTPGFAEAVLDRESRNSDQLSQIIRDITLLELSYIHEIWLTIPISNKIDNELQEAITSVLKLFRGIEEIIKPIFTKAQMIEQKELDKRIKIWINYFNNRNFKLNWNHYAKFGGLDINSYEPQKDIDIVGKTLEIIRHEDSLKWRKELLDGLKITKHRMSVYCLEDLQSNNDNGKSTIWNWIKSIKEYLIGSEKDKCKILDTAGRTEILFEHSKKDNMKEEI